MMEFSTSLEEAVQQAAAQYFRLVLVVGLPGCGKTALLRSLATSISCQPVNVNLELSRRMLELSRVQRSRQVERLFRQLLDQQAGELVILDNLEVLFDAELEIEPVRLLQVSSRNRVIVASWNGSYENGTLTYAEPGHPEFVQFKQIEAIVVSVGSKQKN